MQNNVKRIISVSDLQYPYHDRKVWKAVLNFVKDFNPHIVIVNGDGFDFYDLSKYDKNPQRCGKLDLELEGFRDEVLVPLGRASPLASERHYMEGNHERRFTKYLWHQAPALSNFKGLRNAGEAIDVEKFNMEYHNENQHLSLGHLLVLHGHIIRKHGGWTAKAHFERYGTSLLVGHSHRWGTFAVRDWKGCHIAEEQGCLCDMNPEYDPHPNWQQGFAVAFIHSDKYFDLQVVRIIDRKFFHFGTERYLV